MVGLLQFLLNWKMVLLWQQLFPKVQDCIINLSPTLKELSNPDH